MPLDWVDVTDLSFNTVLLLERAQLAWLPGWLPEPELGIALRANPAVAWFLRHENPGIADWVDRVLAAAPESSPPDAVREAERAVLASMGDLVCYAVDPAAYDRQEFLKWDERELTDLVDFRGKLVADVGAGTGKLALIAARAGARAVFAVDPVGNLREYLFAKSRAAGLANVFPVDGLVTRLPFPDGFLDAVLGGHVFGDHPEEEHAELVRVTRPGGAVILCPGAGDRDEERHAFLAGRGFDWGRFEEPGIGTYRKYWKTVPADQPGADVS